MAQLGKTGGVIMEINKNLFNEEGLVQKFWTEMEKTEPYTTNNGKRYCEVEAEDCYIVNMWCRLIPGLTRPFHSNGKSGCSVLICID